MQKKLIYGIVIFLLLFQLINFNVIAVDNNVYVPLGEFSVNNVQNDGKYDWGHSIIKVDGLYKAWWTRGDPYDTIWYAESTDGNNWYNAVKVLSSSETTWEKTHVARPTVVYTNNKYFMFYETSRTIASNGVESDNNIMLATSVDGKNWNKYPTNAAPSPVIQQPASTIGKGYYGVGQPSVSYKDNQFIMYYTFAAEPLAGATGGNFIARTTSTDGYVWSGGSETHPRLVVGSGADVKYSTMLNKYVMFYTLNNQVGRSSPPPDSSFNYGLHYVISTDSQGSSWPATTMWDMASNTNNIVRDDTTRKTRCFASVITDKLGNIEGKTWYVTSSAGTIHLPSQDFKTYANTWDGEMNAVKISDYSSDTLLPPEGLVFKKSTDSTIYSYVNATKQGYSSMAALQKANGGRSFYMTLPVTIVDAIPTGGTCLERLNVSITGSSIVYNINKGIKRQYVDTATFNAINGVGDTVFSFASSVINPIPVGSYYLEGLNVKGSGSSIYKIQNSKKYPYVNYETFLALNSNTTVYTVSDSVINSFTTGEYYLNGLNVQSDSGTEIIYCTNLKDFTTSIFYSYTTWGNFLDKNKNVSAIYIIPNSIYTQVKSTFQNGGFRP